MGDIGGNMFDQIITAKMVGLTIAQVFPTLKEAVIDKADLTAMKMAARDEFLAQGLEGCAMAFEQKTGIASIIENVG